MDADRKEFMKRCVVVFVKGFIEGFVQGIVIAAITWTIGILIVVTIWALKNLICKVIGH